MPVAPASVPKILIVPAGNDPKNAPASPPAGDAPRMLRPRTRAASCAAAPPAAMAQAPSAQGLKPPSRRRRAHTLDSNRASVGHRADTRHSTPAPQVPRDVAVPKPSAAAGLEIMAQVLKRLGAAQHTAEVTSWPTEQQRVLGAFLQQLVRTEHARGKDACPVLRLQVHRLVDNACRLPLFRKRALETLQGALTQYGQRPIRVLDDIEVLLEIEDIRALPMAEATLAMVLLGCSVMRRGRLRALAQLTHTLVPTMTAAEIAFVFETHLRDRLGLPGMAAVPSGPCVLPLGSLDAAVQATEIFCADAGNRRAFFDSWLPWQNLSRKGHAAAHNFSHITKKVGQVVEGEARCPLTSKKAHQLTQPVYMGKDASMRVFEYEVMMAWWVAFGTEPLTEHAMTLQQLWVPA